jgi:hypothetical protein
MVAATFAAGAMLTAGATAVQATTLPPVVVACAPGDLNPAATACSGFYAGNLLNNNATNLAYQTQALADLGFAWDGVTYENATNQPLGGADPIFSHLLDGVIYVGIHYGAGTGSPGGALDPKKNTTAFYKLTVDDTHTFELNYNASSGARYYFGAPCVGDGCGGGNNSVPEPATWLMMIMGFGGVGAVIRRRRHAMAFA